MNSDNQKPYKDWYTELYQELDKLEKPPIILFDEYEIPCPKCKHTKEFGWEWHDKYSCPNGYKVDID